ncbi:MFS transporter [Herbiconiux sp. SYSU D00978]|uniref:MFS transporter n=1 Tax=Herbiconiux sp. SYSU D00978 TaxID=2812562 RepID=UPI001A95A17D|nr:MFS transporter [Herbiconiux sp. SYSU D00978]
MSIETTESHVLKDRNFRLLWGADGISQFGTQLAGIAIPVIAVELLGAGALELGALEAASSAAFLLVGLPAGAWVDRMLKRRVLIAGDLVRALALAVIPLLWLAGALEFWHLVAVSAIVGIATVFFDVAYQSYLPILVGGAQLRQGNSVLQATAEVARIGGPGVGGALLTVLQAPLLVLGNAVSYVLSALIVLFIRDREQPSDPDERRPLHVEIAEGVRFVLGQRLIRSVALATASFNFFATLVFTLYPLLVLEQLGLSPAVLGLTFSVASVGGLLGAVLTPRAAKLFGEARVIPLSAVLGAIALVPIPLAALLPDAAIALLVAGQFLTSFTIVVYNVTQVTMRQRLCPPKLLGRMNASIRVLVWGVMPIGALLSGVLGEALGVLPVFWIGVVGTFLGCGFVVFSPLSRMRELPKEQVVV